MDEKSSIPQEYLDQLTKLGLWHSSPMGCFAGGCWIAKPVTTDGNSIPNYEGGFVSLGSDESEKDLAIQSDATMLSLSPDKTDGKWIVRGVEGCGGMLPTDFINAWDTLDEAILDIRDFYFGDPTRINSKATIYSGLKKES